MKKLCVFITILAIAGFVFADGKQGGHQITDPELVYYLDTAFPNVYMDGLVVVGRFNGDYGGSNGSNFKGMLTELVSGLSSDVLEALNESAKLMFQELFGEATPNRNWSVVVDINTYTVKQVFQARDIANTGRTDENGKTVYTGVLGSNQSGDGDAYSSKWSYSNMTGQTLGFEVPVTDENGETHNEMTYFKVAAAVNWSPIMLDMDMDGKPDTNRNAWLPHAPAFYPERTAKFDMSGDGLPEFAEWLGSNDALLVLPDPDGKVRGALNLFGNAGGYADGYEKMATILDLDGNGWVEKEELNGLYLWKDLNGNAIVEQGEMKTVQEYGVEKISVHHKNFQSVCYIKGKEVKTWDWWPACYELMKEKRK